jgi:hypothetical protein
MLNMNTVGQRMADKLFDVKAPAVTLTFDLKINKGLLLIMIMCGGVAVWLMRWTSNLRIADRVGSNPIRGKPLFPRARNFTFIS